MDRRVLKGQAILLIEEQPNAARTLQSALERFGAEVVPAQDAVAARERRGERDFSWLSWMGALTVLRSSLSPPEISKVGNAGTHLVARCKEVMQVRETSQGCRRAVSGAVQLEVKRIELRTLRVHP